MPARSAAVVLAALAATTATAPVSAATVTPVSADRFVSISIPSNNPEVAPAVSETIRSTGFNPFSARIGNSVTSDFGQFSEAFADQESLLTPAGNATLPEVGFQFSGSTNYDSVNTGELTSARTAFEIVFDLQGDADFFITGAGEYTDTAGGASGYNVSVARADGTGTVASFFGGGSTGPSGGISGLQEVEPFSTGGTLTRGRWMVSAGSGVSGGIGGTSSAIDVRLTLTGATLAPSPAALPAGAVLLGGLLARRRR